MPTKAPRRREAVKTKSITRNLREQITSGHLLPGGRLPTRENLEQFYGASRLTVQRALDQLVQDGFVYVQGRQATFVADAPPHLHRVALVFPAHVHQSEWNGFWTALSREAANLEREEGAQIPHFYGVDGHTDAEDYGRLEREVEAQRLRGIIFAVLPAHLQLSGVLDSPIARVATMRSGNVPNVPAVALDNNSLIAQALEYLRDLGRRRIAVLADPVWLQKHRATLESSLAAHGLESRPYWIQGVSPEARDAARGCAHLLAHSRALEAFDGFFIADDNLLEPALGGLLMAGTKVPGDVAIVAHGNFPSPRPSLVPLQRVGFSAAKVLRACLQSIDEQTTHLEARHQQRREGIESPEAMPVPDFVIEAELESAA